MGTTVIAAINGILAVLEILVPKIVELTKAGEITPEQQQALLDRKDAILGKLDEAFSGPEWVVEPSVGEVVVPTPVAPEPSTPTS